MRLTKTYRARRVHAVRRLYERYDLQLSRHDYQELCRLIQRRQATLLERQTCSRLKLLVNYRGHDIIVVYSTTTRQVVTALPRETEETDIL